MQTNLNIIESYIISCKIFNVYIALPYYIEMYVLYLCDCVVLYIMSMPHLNKLYCKWP